VKAGERTEQTLNLHAGYLQLFSIAAKDGAPVTGDLRYDVYHAKQDRDGKRVHVDYYTDASPLIRLPAGNYYISVEHRGASGSAEVEVLEGVKKELTLQIQGP
jgi:hypothetical protein